MRARFLVALGAFFGVGCAAILGIDDGVPRTDAGTVDAAVEATPDVSVDRGPDVVVSTTCKPAAPFTSIKPLTELNTTGDDQHPRLSPDEKTVVFQRQQPGFVVFTASRADRLSTFSAPVSIAELAVGGDAADPTLDSSGLRIVFASGRVGGVGSYDLWVATRTSVGSAFSAPTVLTGLNGTAIDHYPNFAGAGALYFSSVRPTGLGSEDIYRSAVNGSVISAPVLVAGLSGAGYDAAPAVTPDELLAYVETSITDDAGTSSTIFVSSRASTAAPWPTPTVVAELRNAESIPTWISADGCRLYFSSNRSGNWDLWVAERTP